MLPQGNKKPLPFMAILQKEGGEGAGQIVVTLRGTSTESDWAKGERACLGLSVC